MMDEPTASHIIASRKEVWALREQVAELEREREILREALMALGNDTFPDKRAMREFARDALGRTA